MRRLILLSVLICGLAQSAGAIATPTAISTATLSGNTLTVNSTAHGLAANQGFCITGSSVAADNVCAVVASASANSFTFTMAGLAACAATCGTVAPARQVIILDTLPISQAEINVHYLLWLTTQQGTATSSSSALTSATTAELAAIGAGRFVEMSRTKTIPAGSTLAQVKTILQLDYTAQQQAVANNVQPGQFFGNYFDGVSWLQ